MKRIFLACTVVISALALATATNSTGINSVAKNSCNYQDTIPKKDTTKVPKKDSLLFSSLFKK